MNVVRLSLTLAISLMASSACLAQAAAAPAGSTGLCKDGTYTTIAPRRAPARATRA